jgi:hypothetical protein
MELSEKKITKTYNFTQQEDFSVLSGDFNPVHLDSIFARRELVGEIVVHGIHLVLGALDFLIDSQLVRQRIFIHFIKVKFHNPVYINNRITISINQDFKNAKIVIRDVKSLLLSEIILRYGFENALFGGSIIKSNIFNFKFPINNSINELVGQHGNCELYLNDDLCKKILPNVYQYLSHIQIAELLALTRIVGMECPGLKSLFSGFELESKNGNLSRIDYKVSNVIERFSMVNLDIVGPSFSGILETFYRPEPIVQPTIMEISQKIEYSSLENMVALIIGGSRGIGETTAKIIAAGGGTPIITYFKGKQDAEKICKEICDAKYNCYLKMININDLEKSLDDFNDLLKVNTIFYFASPKIFVKKAIDFDRDLFDSFFKYYVDSFYELIKLTRQKLPQNLNFFYPSSIAIDERAADLTEYIMAKKAGEHLCEILRAKYNGLNILFERLPRMHSDQTLNLFQFPAASTFDVMYPLINEMYTFLNTNK